jgi:putative FmdB family regulatory protein
VPFGGCPETPFRRRLFGGGTPASRLTERGEYERGINVAGTRLKPPEGVMPIYEYICRECRHAFEVLQRIGERGDQLICPACKKVGADRQLSTFAGHASHGSGGSVGAAGCGAGGFT